MVILLALCVGAFDAALPSSGTAHTSGIPSPMKLAKMVEGRARLCFIRKGMREAEVTRVLGEPGGTFVHCMFRCEDLVYPDYAVRVSLVDGEVSSYGVYRWTPRPIGKDR
jgi:hypothetical protein